MAHLRRRDSLAADVRMLPLRSPNCMKSQRVAIESENDGWSRSSNRMCWRAAVQSGQFAEIGVSEHSAREQSAESRQGH